MGSKIKTFLDLLEQGNTIEAARTASEVSEATSKIQFAKWNKSKGNVVAKKEVKKAGKKDPIKEMVEKLGVE